MAFLALLAGFHLTFDPQHFAGFLGMPRRIFTYEAGRGWEFWNQMSTVGVFLQGAAVIFFVVNVIYSYIKGKEAGDDPWDAWTLEWATRRRRRSTILTRFPRSAAVGRCGI